MTASIDPTRFEARALEHTALQGAPPVHLWHPAHCGVIDIRIRRDGVWLHEGRPVSRAPLVKLFASILRLDTDGFHLVTPVEKLRIEVDDAPFMAVAMECTARGVTFDTNVGDRVTAGAEHPIDVVIDPGSGAPSPYVHVRRGLRARLTRPVFYELAEAAQVREGRFGVVSNGVWFDLGDAA